MESGPNVSPARRYVPVASALLAVLAVAMIASTVHVGVTRTNGPGTTPRPITQPSLPPPPSPAASPASTSAPNAAVAAWVGQLFRVLVGVALLAVLALVVLVVHRIVAELRASRPEEAFPDGPVTAVDDRAEHDRAERERVAAAVASGLTELADARDPRGAVIAAWVRLESAAERAGRTRRPGDTPTDLVTGLLAERQVQPDALARFAALYLAARYSRRDVDPAMRDDALAALRTIEQSLREVASTDEHAAAIDVSSSATRDSR